MQAIKDAQRDFEHRRRTFGDIFAPDYDSDDGDADQPPETGKKAAASSSSSSTDDGDSDAPTSTDSDSPYGSDSESSSSYDEYYAQREIPKKKVHRHHKGPLKLYIQEVIGNWPKYRYKKYKRTYMKKMGVQITYGNVHTRSIKRSLKKVKRDRERKESQTSTTHVANLLEDVARQTKFLSLDSQRPLIPAGLEAPASSAVKPAGSEVQPEAPKTKSTLTKMKHKIKKSLRRKHKIATANNVVADDTEEDDDDDDDDARSQANIEDDDVRKSDDLVERL